MYWCALQLSCRQGCIQFDMDGEWISNLCNFKVGFGAELVNYSNIQKAHGWLVWIIMDCKKFFISSLRKVPQHS